MKGLSVALALGGGLWMRLAMLKAIPQITGDTLLYGDMAKNLLHGQFAITDGSGATHATLIRLPGYPLFLAACFRLFGLENYTAASYMQIGLELAGCLLLAAFVRRIATEAAAHWTLWLAALCPFTAAYAVAPMAETPTLFAIALALWALARFHARPGWGNALAFTFAVSFAALLRPVGALVGATLTPALVWGLWRGEGKKEAAEESLLSSERPDGSPAGAEAPIEIGAGAAPFDFAQGRLLKSCPDTSGLSGRVLPQPVKPGPTALWRMGVVCAVLALAPFAIWTARNWRVFHVFEPLAPRYATDPGEPTDAGWQRWTKTWCLDFVSTYDIYWNMPGSPIDLSKLPARAFDSPAQYAETAALVAAYDKNGEELSAEIDAGFAQLAEERVRARPLRYYLWLPLGRMADMWLRPRVENLNIDLDWWVASHHYAETRFSWAYAGLNAAYLMAALIGLCFRPRDWTWLALYFVLRSAMLMTIEAPEARYTLECFPMVFALGGIGICGADGKFRKSFTKTRTAGM